MDKYAALDTLLTKAAILKMAEENEVSPEDVAEALSTPEVAEEVAEALEEQKSAMLAELVEEAALQKLAAIKPKYGLRDLLKFISEAKAGKIRWTPAELRGTLEEMGSRLTGPAELYLTARQHPYLTAGVGAGLGAAGAGLGYLAGRRKKAAEFLAELLED